MTVLDESILVPFVSSLHPMNGTSNNRRIDPNVPDCKPVPFYASAKQGAAGGGAEGGGAGARGRGARRGGGAPPLTKSASHGRLPMLPADTERDSCRAGRSEVAKADSCELFSRRSDFGRK